MKTAEVHKLSSQEIAEELVRLQRQMFDLRCQAATEKIEDPSKFKKVRRDVARLMTERRTREIASPGSTAVASKPSAAPASKPARAAKPASTKTASKSKSTK